MTIDDTTERISSTRTIPAAADDVFAVLSDPRRHKDLDPSDWGWVRDAVETAPITEVGQVFPLNMYLEAGGGDYVMHNRVTKYETDRVIAWEPGQPGEDGVLDAGGWVWRYDLAPGGEESCDVTLSYDWSAVPAHTRAEFPTDFPLFPPPYLDESLAALEQAVTG